MIAASVCGSTGFTNGQLRLVLGEATNPDTVPAEGDDDDEEENDSQVYHDVH